MSGGANLKNDSKLSVMKVNNDNNKNPEFRESVTSFDEIKDEI